MENSSVFAPPRILIKARRRRGGVFREIRPPLHFPPNYPFVYISHSTKILRQNSSKRSMIGGNLVACCGCNVTIKRSSKKPCKCRSKFLKPTIVIYYLNLFTYIYQKFNMRNYRPWIQHSYFDLVMILYSENICICPWKCGKYLKCTIYIMIKLRVRTYKFRHQQNTIYMYTA